MSDSSKADKKHKKTRKEQRKKTKTFVLRTAERFPPLPIQYHTFTHFHLDLQLMLYSGNDWARLDAQDGEWWPVGRIGEAGLPSLFAKAATRARGET